MNVPNVGAVSLPVFLVGSQRSGSTLLRLMLDQHPQIAFHSEAAYFVTSLPESGGWPDLERYYEELALDRTFLDRPFEVDRSLDYPHLVRSFLQQLLAHTGKRVAGATVHIGFDRLPRIWDDAKYIHLVRDGRDVANSAVRMGWAGNAWDGAGVWIEAERTWDRLRAELAPTRYIEVKYERLLSSSVSELQRLCDFIGVPFDPAMFGYAENSTYDLPDARLAQQWRRKMAEREVQLVEARTADLLVRSGYELSGYPPVEVGGVRRRLLRLQSRLGRARFRLRRYRFRLFISDMFARRMCLKGWENRIRQRINAIDSAHVQ